MASTKLLIKSKKKSSLAKVYLRFRQGNSLDYTIPTQFMMYPEYWNNNSQTFKSRMTFTDTFTPIDKDQLEIQFRNLKTFILNKLSSSQEMTKEKLQQYVFEFHNPDSIYRNDVSLNEYIAKFIKEAQDGIRLSEKSTNYSSAFIKSMKAFQSQFDLFQKAKKKKLSYEDIDMKFYNEFLTFFNKKDYSPNTIGKNIKMLKFFMRSSRDEGLHKNIEIDKRKFKAPFSEADTIYLNEDELRRMYELDLSNLPKLEKSRDVFLIGCYVAQRFGDFSTIHKDQIKDYGNGIKVIHLVQNKTNTTVIIPIRPELEKILAKYNYTVPKTSDQRVNRGIKVVGMMLGLDEPIVLEKYQGGRKVSNTFPKYQLISTHTARRSGCTNMYLAGIPSIDVMKISGHKTEKEFLKYIRITKRENAIGLAGHRYFRGK